MTGPPDEKRRPGGGGAHDHLDADLARQYTYTAELASIPSLIAMHVGAAHLAALAARGAL